MPEEVQAEGEARRRAVAQRGRDKRPRIRRFAKKPPVPEEMMPGAPRQDEPKAPTSTLTELAKELQTDPQYIEALRSRMRAGTATATEQRLLIELARLEQEEKIKPVEQALALLSPFEKRVLAHMLSRESENYTDFTLLDGRSCTLGDVFRLAGASA